MSIELNRRDLLAGVIAFGGATALPAMALESFAAVPKSQFVELIAAPAIAPILGAQSEPTSVWAFGGSIPGPEIRVQAGEYVRRRVTNKLPQNTAVHWHGIRIDNAMDGASGLTQAPIEPGASFDYDFIAPDPGTYWYHSHDRSWEQVARGMAGPLIVEDSERWSGLEGAATRELTLMLDDWYLRGDGKIEEGNFGALHEWAHAGRIGNVMTVNGIVKPDISVRAGERLRLRFINAANARIMPIRIEDHDAKLIALDGHPVNPRDAEDGVLLTPAQRADVVIDCKSQPASRVPLLVDIGQGEWLEVATLVYSLEEPLPPVEGAVRPLPMTMLHDLDLGKAQQETLTMEGGAMGNLMSARLGGVDHDFRELVARKRVWAFNGVAGDLAEPVFSARRGTTVRLTIRNQTGFPHGIHVHGHHFEVLSTNGVPAPYGDRRDTILTERDDVVEIAFKADNPGKWLLHCHMLEHQAAGMLAWFEVE